MTKLNILALFTTILTFLSFRTDSTSAWQLSRNAGRAFRSKSMTDQAPENKALKFRSDASSEEEFAVMSAAVANAFPQPSLVEPNAWDLPRHSPPAKEVRRQQLIWDAELFLGRIAMMVSMVLLVEEVVTGLSFSDQLQHFLQ